MKAEAALFLVALSQKSAASASLLASAWCPRRTADAEQRSKRPIAYSVA